MGTNPQIVGTSWEFKIFEIKHGNSNTENTQSHTKYIRISHQDLVEMKVIHVHREHIST